LSYRSSREDVQGLFGRGRRESPCRVLSASLVLTLE
jgi:hypothetical protein